MQVKKVKGTESSRSPAAPYMTSSMLMDASNQLGNSVATTMSAAQGLFEGAGLTGVEGMGHFECSCRLCAAVTACRVKPHICTVKIGQLST